jgi:hypothetical protein
MSFETGKTYRLKASKRPFKVLQTSMWGMITIKFEGDREKVEIMQNALAPESEEVSE